jgi:hypothetical protein
MDIMHHPEAEWQTGDFDFGSHQPSHSHTPYFLQPVHQPQIRLPSISWFEDRHACPSNSPHHSQTWSPTTSNLAADHAQSPTIHHSNTPVQYPQNHMPQAAFRDTVASETTSPSVLGVPMAVPIGRLVNDMPSPSNKRRHEVFEDQAVREAMVQRASGITGQAHLPAVDIKRPKVRRQSKSKPKAKMPQAESGLGPYIHSLCGSGFSTRSKVKKHHWGYVLDDINTTTGCWAKYGKPNVSWNEHPSCREGMGASTAPITRIKGEPQEPLPMMPPIIPTHQELPEAGAYVSVVGEYHQDAPQEMPLYHSHRLPNRSSFDTLLSAVNAVSQIDAPQPQGRIDSVISHLDAQAAAAEYSRQYVADWQDALECDPREAAASGYQHPYTTLRPSVAYPLRGYHVPLEIALPSSGRPQAYIPHMYPSTTGNWVDDHVSMWEDAHSSRAPLEPLSPDPYAGSR